MKYSYIYSPMKLSVLVFIFFFSSFAEVYADPPQRLILSSLSLLQETRATYADFSVTIDDEEGLSDMLKNGSTVELSISLHTERKRSWWGNSLVSRSQHTYTLLYQPLTRDFVLSFPEDSHVNQVRDKSLPHLLQENWHTFHLEVVTREQLDQQPKDREYEVEVGVSIHYKEIPPWLEKNSLFWSADIVPEEKISAIFHY